MNGTNEGPKLTADAEYNALLVRWAAQGDGYAKRVLAGEAPPTCERCEADLTGAAVCANNCCKGCHDTGECGGGYVPYANWREDFHADG